MNKTIDSYTEHYLLGILRMANLRPKAKRSLSTIRKSRQEKIRQMTATKQVATN